MPSQKSSSAKRSPKQTETAKAHPAPRRNARLAAQFRATFEQAAVGMAHVALDGRWLRVNQKLCDILGYSYEELTRQTFQDITYPPDLPEDLALLAKLQAGEINTYALEKRYIRRDGSLIWANLTVSLVSNADGSPDYFISVVEDISQRKQLEEIATTTALQLAGVLDVLPMGVIIADAEGRLIQSNQEADRIW